jgi:hypothetical protein
MNDTEDLLVASIDEMIVRAAKRLVEHRLLIESLPPVKRRKRQRELERRREVIDRLSTLRKAMISERSPGSLRSAGASIPKRMTAFTSGRLP